MHGVTSTKQTDWTVPTLYLNFTWTVHGLYLNYIWTIREPYIDCTWGVLYSSCTVHFETYVILLKGFSSFENTVVCTINFFLPTTNDLHRTRNSLHMPGCTVQALYMHLTYTAHTPYNAPYKHPTSTLQAPYCRVQFWASVIFKKCSPFLKMFVRKAMF